ncbi:Smr/MutS family protein [Sphingomonas hankyongi]|uniref:Smr/MutS family protein n=1 Tax=Sphingomonas hankyongi TaxID=2908209 RepID=UPI003241CE4B
MRSLNPEEASLWARVTASIRPLSRDAPEREAPAERAIPASATAKRIPPLRPTAIEKSTPRPHASATLDGSWDKRLRSGSVEPDRTVDLHGMTLDRAWQTIDAQLDRAIRQGDRLMLLITGHHRPGHPPVARGRIRAAVHDWLAASRHASHIAAVRDAHRRHGGGGSLYIVLRRAR